jgi:hypothetical protein
MVGPNIDIELAKMNFGLTGAASAASISLSVPPTFTE